MLDMVEEVSGQLREMGFVADAQLIGNVHPPLPAELGKANPGIGCLQRRNPALAGRSLQYKGNGEPCRGRKLLAWWIT